MTKYSDSSPSRSSSRSRSSSPRLRRSPSIENSPRSRQNGDRLPQQSTVYVGFIDPYTTESKLNEFFSQYAPVQDVKLVRDTQRRRQKTYGFVMFANSDDAHYAVSKADGRTLDGSKISCNIAKYPKGNARKITRSRYERRSPPRYRDSRSPPSARGYRDHKRRRRSSTPPPRRHGSPARGRRSFSPSTSRSRSLSRERARDTRARGRGQSPGPCSDDVDSPSPSRGVKRRKDSPDSEGGKAGGKEEHAAGGSTEDKLKAAKKLNKELKSTNEYLESRYQHMATKLRAIADRSTQRGKLLYKLSECVVQLTSDYKQIDGTRQRLSELAQEAQHVLQRQEVEREQAKKGGEGQGEDEAPPSKAKVKSERDEKRQGSEKQEESEEQKVEEKDEDSGEGFKVKPFSLANKTFKVDV